MADFSKVCTIIKYCILEKCDRLCINHPFTAFIHIWFFNVVLYIALFMLIIMAFFLFLFDLRFKTYGCPNVTVLKFFLLRKVRFSVHCNYSVPRSVNHAVVLTHITNAALDRSGFLRSGITRYYSKKPSSVVTTRCDEENQVFLTMDCDRLQGPFTSPHSLSVNGSSSVAPGETICSRRFIPRHKIANTP